MRLIILLSLLSISFCSSAAVYRWVDENGKVHYSDEPQPNAELVEVKQNTQNTIELREAKITSPIEPDDAVAQTTITIISPTHEETIRSNEGKFDVTVSVAPKLLRGMFLALFIDGEIKAQPQTSTTFNLEGIYRGEHAIVVKALDQNGKVLASSSPRTIYLHQATLVKRPTPRGG
ncbi:DUF4124 domain-containing protein [Shewanella subflava]|uniref:DUF4124 domain-containing protein n=1 Tax=Shewanella subflava TaxID=2986476 RepID=A0ABT3I7Y5_9GAMM|nr:DUF4124 domain-containing protein [Shewanella subflava]MCW3172074.1 DUF4124 domain-containing protein [Shewanella subflava]